MSIGVWQVVIVLVIVVIIFGAGKLPHVMGDVAKGIKNFKKGLADNAGSRNAGHFMPEEGRSYRVSLDPEQTFVFPIRDKG